jgi:hypothetical protein
MIQKACQLKNDWMMAYTICPTKDTLKKQKEWKDFSEQGINLPKILEDGPVELRD